MMKRRKWKRGGWRWQTAGRATVSGFVGVGSEIGGTVGEGNTSQPSPCISFIIIPLYCEPTFE